jgi:hypothetical protein
MNKAVVSTSSRPGGNIIIDTYRPLSGVKWLTYKPLNKFVDAQWLLIQKVEDKLLKVTIKLEDFYGGLYFFVRIVLWLDLTVENVRYYFF